MAERLHAHGSIRILPRSRVFDPPDAQSRFGDVLAASLVFVTCWPKFMDGGVEKVVDACVQASPLLRFGPTTRSDLAGRLPNGSVFQPRTGTALEPHCCGHITMSLTITANICNEGFPCGRKEFTNSYP